VIPRFVCLVMHDDENLEGRMGAREGCAARGVE